mgnify:CR=1 FL=1
MITEEKIKLLYEKGSVGVGNLFNNNYLDQLQKIKNELFKEFPYGQDDQLNKKNSSDFVRPGSHMIWDLIDRSPIFSKILDNENIKKISTRVLGANYNVASFYIRKTPKINEKLNPHIDYQGGLSFSILLDDIKENEGETFFYPRSHKLPPPPFVDFKKNSVHPVSITGKLGDTFFWFPDCWHGRNENLNDKETTILMCHLGNSNYPTKDPIGRMRNYNNKKIASENKENNKFLHEFFKFFGRAPNSILRHIIYCIAYFKLKGLSNFAISKNTIYTRKKYGDSKIDSFSIINYFKVINPSKTITIIIKNFIKLILGKRLVGKIKKS